ADRFPRGGIPEACGLVVGSREDAPALGAEGGRHDAVSVAKGFTDGPEPGPFAEQGLEALLRSPLAGPGFQRPCEQRNRARGLFVALLQIGGRQIEVVSSSHLLCPINLKSDLLLGLSCLESKL